MDTWQACLLVDPKPLHREAEKATGGSHEIGTRWEDTRDYTGRAASGRLELESGLRETRVEGCLRETDNKRDASGRLEWESGLPEP
ncbi:hypothetical protein BGX38DRAFT_1277266 [Terfezia claveryi]|nr:hypothetical protein BGX38DRAFT_1277266 [Terfezia claveryi]